MGMEEVLVSRRACGGAWRRVSVGSHGIRLVFVFGSIGFGRRSSGFVCLHVGYFGSTLLLIGEACSSGALVLLGP